jgi:hypothetical protein
MLKIKLWHALAAGFLLLVVYPLYSATVRQAISAGTVPAVNTDMGCSLAGQVLQYTGSTIGCAAPTRPTATVSTLPTCNSGAQGQMYFVTDSLLPAALAIVAAGGAVKIGVTCNGTNWIVQ